MKQWGFKNNPPSVVLAEPFGSETRRRAQVESLKADLFTAEAYLKVANFLAGEPFSRPRVYKPYIS